MFFTTRATNSSSKSGQSGPKGLGRNVQGHRLDDCRRPKTRYELKSTRERDDYASYLFAAWAGRFLHLPRPRPGHRWVRFPAELIRTLVLLLSVISRCNVSTIKPRERYPKCHPNPMTAPSIRSV